jgi:hypothetical protein
MKMGIDLQRSTAVHRGRVEVFTARVRHRQVRDDRHRQRFQFDGLFQIVDGLGEQTHGRMDP